MRNESGFTLIEVVSVLVVVSVLAVFASPTVDHWKSKLALRAEISRLVGELHKARFSAICSNSYVVFSYTENGYMIFIDNGSEGGIKEDWVNQPGEQVLADVTLDKQLKIVLSDSSFTSHRTRFSGSPGIKAGTVVMQGSDGSKVKVVVNAIGRVRTEKM